MAQAKPTIAVIEFKNKANNQWWYHGGAEAAQDVFITELGKLNKFKVMDREQLEEIMNQRNLSLSGEVDAKMAVKVAKILGVNYLLTGSVTEYGVTPNGTGGGLSVGKRNFVAALNAQLIDSKTGKIVWSGAESTKTDSVKVSVFGIGGGVDDNRMFDKVLKPTIVTLVAKLKSDDPLK